MLHLRRCILAHLLPSPATSIFPLHRLLSVVSPNPSFAPEEYLVGTCGLTRAQALKASPKLYHLKSSSKPDAVLAFLAVLGFSSADVAALVAKDPQFLCAKVGKTLSPNVVALTGLGISYTEIARLVSLAPVSFRQRSIVSNLPYCMSLFGSFESLLEAAKRGSGLLSSDLDNTVKPIVRYLQGCGLNACHIAKLFIDVPRILGIRPERLRVMVACADRLGVPRESVMFRHALHAVAFLSEEKIAAQVDNLKNMFSWSDAEVRISVSKFPLMLTRSKDNLQRRSEFLISQVGLEPAYIANHPALLSYSVERRLKPRYYAVKFLKENGLLDRDRDYYYAVSMTEKAFMDKYISTHSEAAPYLAQDYATACRGDVPPRFIFA